MKISFGAKLLTTPEQFVHRSDAPEDRRKAMRFVHGLKILVESPVFNSLTANDTLELRRTPSKKGHFNYHMSYKSPEITDINSFEDITMEIGNKLDIGEVLGAFEQVSYAPMYKKGAFGEEYAFSDTYDDLFIKTFKMSFNDFLNTLGQKNNS